MKTTLIKSSYLNNLQPSIKEELLGISGLEYRCSESLEESQHPREL